MFRCPECGRWLQTHYTPGRNGKAYLGYKCRFSRNLPVSCDWRRIISEGPLERELLPALLDRLATYEPAEPARRQTQAVRRAQAARERLDAERARIVRLAVKGLVGEEEAEGLLADVNRRLGEAGQAEPAARKPELSAQEVREIVRTLRRSWSRLEPQRRRTLLQAAIMHILPDADALAASEIFWRMSW
ncbi:MAG TPA: hypothetical protein PLJ35_05225 [Anaerolineae bacterium]|mgnify:CR=1 FL=1|nr:hypothetical protein [Anaerolineae bacterium]